MDLVLADEHLSRRAWGMVLAFAAVFAVAGAGLLESLGLVSQNVRPLPYVFAIVAIQLGLFVFWPVIIRKGREAGTVLSGLIKDAAEPRAAAATSAPFAQKSAQRKPMVLWDDKDPRVDVQLFAANVPTFVIDHEQRFLDWNPAFHLVFGQCAGVQKRAHVSAWFEHLDNFRRVSKREEKLYGEGILPLADRERASFQSPLFGRMVFTKIMSPIVDRSTGRVVGWNVVLNVNSVTKRAEFLERLHAGVQRETRRIRFAAAYDGLFRDYAGYKTLIAAHLRAVGDAARVLELGAGTGELTQALVRPGRRVTAVERSVHLLRKLKDKIGDEALERRVKVVKQDPDQLRNLPADRYDAAVLMQLPNRLTDLPAALTSVHRSLKPGGVLSLSAVVEGGSVESLFEHLRAQLVRTERFEALKHQYNQVLEHEQTEAAQTPYRFQSRESLRAAVLEAGFFIEDETTELVDGHTLLLYARK